MPVQGVETGLFGAWLTEYFRSSPRLRKHEVFFDHGDTSRYPNVVAPKAFGGDTVSNLTRLADVDVLVARPDGVADLIVEIEERPSAPKKVLGDVMALLLCNQLAAKVGTGQRYFRLTHATELIVAGIQPGKGKRLEKMKAVVEPRLRRLSAPSDSLDPKNIHLIFQEDINDAIAAVRQHVERKYGKNKSG